MFCARQAPRPLQTLGSSGLLPKQLKLGPPAVVNWHRLPVKPGLQTHLSGPAHPPLPLHTFGSNAIFPKQMEISHRSPARPQLQEHWLFPTHVPAPEQACGELEGTPKHVNAGSHVASTELIGWHTSVNLLHGNGTTCAVPAGKQQLCVALLMQMPFSPPGRPQPTNPGLQQTAHSGPPGNTWPALKQVWSGPQQPEALVVLHGLGQN